ncbi:MAG: hypothetical protein NTW66_00560 [Candidatus Magasanikbacteria bacterium]|nr:hypothetical protein [Candidatus Magasanikbacteria bacterium]
MPSTSSIPPPDDRIPPFPAKEETGKCYISGEPIGPHDKIVLIPVDGGKRRNPAKLDALFEVLGLSTNDEQRVFCQGFIATSMDRPSELLWYKLSRHNPLLFQLLLAWLDVY